MGTLDVWFRTRFRGYRKNLFLFAYKNYILRERNPPSLPQMKKLNMTLAVIISLCWSAEVLTDSGETSFREVCYFRNGSNMLIIGSKSEDDRLRALLSKTYDQDMKKFMKNDLIASVQEWLKKQPHLPQLNGKSDSTGYRNLLETCLLTKPAFDPGD